MKRLAICNSYYQLFIMIQLRLTLFEGDQIDLWISDHSNNSVNVYNQLKQMSLFQNVEYIEDKEEIYNSSKFSIFKDIWDVNFGKIKPLVKEKYDEIIFCNYTSFLYRLMDYYDQIGHCCQWSILEEGVLSYDRVVYCGKRIILIEKIRNLIHRNSLFERAKTFYCFFPEVVKERPGWRLVQIPNLKTKLFNLQKALNEIFQYNHNNIKEKFIYFSSSTVVDKCPYGEEKIVEYISDVISHDDLIMKLHPRDNTKMYQEPLYHIMEQSNIPWEVVQINMVSEDHIFLTTTSGAFLNITAILDDNTKSYFLYNLVDNQDKKFVEYYHRIEDDIGRLQSIGLCKETYVVRNKYEFEKMFKKLEEK